MTRRKPKHSRQHGKPVKHGLRIATTAQRNHLTALHRSGQLDELCTTARSLLKDCPDDAFVWTALGSSLLKQQRYEEAQAALTMADKLFPGDQQILDGLTKAQTWLGDHQQAIANQRRSLEIDPNNAAGHFHLASLLHECGDIKALEHLDRAEALGHNPYEVLSLRGNTSSAKFKFHDALHAFRKLIDIAPNSPEALNNLANILKDMGEFREAETTYLKALEINPKHMPAYSNLFFSMHYDPERSAEEILEFAKGWEERFPPSKTHEHPCPEKTMASRPARIGLLSGGLCAHPVGQMIALALEHTDESLEIYAYSTNQMRDHITERIIKCVDSWQAIGHLNPEQLADKIHQDGIDILLDLNGHGAGNRMQSISMRPAPLIVKWVGGLVGSMGLSSFDYLISDSIETPPGVDHLYVEKLIRMPDDYICYLPSEAISPITMLPAATNGYVTLGCFNNPAKINPVLLAEWAKLMHQLPNCRLLLKGAQYDSPEFCERIRNIMREHGIADERLILEGPAKHHELMKAYNRVDIALDPWPYSGGLTTCEAMLMGVPVVTLPGPTFAGRHSATHLINAGMPELVVDSWDQYRQRVIELATDLPNLSVIRACLRRVLMESPVCDGPRFARHFTTAMRAIWQRYCEGKAPTALSLDKNGSARFEDEDTPVVLTPLEQALKESVSKNEAFQWGIEGKIITLDHGASLTNDPAFTELQKTGAFATIVFDPAGKLGNVESLQQNSELHHYPHVALGDGQLLSLYNSSNPSKSSTLEPLPDSSVTPNELAGQAEDRSTIPSLRLDDIEGLESIDWIILDDLNDSLKVLENAQKAVTNTLLIHARVDFTPQYNNQPELSQLNHWLAAHGFSFYRLSNPQNLSFLPERNDLLKKQATQLVSADALFLPNKLRMESLSANQRTKLAFLLHQVYGVHDVTHKIIDSIDSQKASDYLVFNGYIAKPEHPQEPEPRDIKTLIAKIEATPARQKNPNHNLPGNLVVSLTSYKARFPTLHLTLKCLINQDTTPDHLILWIAHEEMALLPEKVLELSGHGLEIRACEDIRSYKKIIPTLREYPDCFIATADDDIYYKPDWLSSLISAWDGDMNTVIAHRAHKIRLDQKGLPIDYSKWDWECREDKTPDGLIFPTTGAGALFPPNSFMPDTSREDIFMRICPDADDVWLYWMTALSGKKAKLSNYKLELETWPNSQASTLWQHNITEGGNNKKIRSMLSTFGKAWAKPKNKEIVQFNYSNKLVKFHLPHRDDHIQKIIKNSLSFYELEMLEDIRSRTTQGGAIIDIGANIGNHTIYFAMFCKAEKIYAFEPQESIFKVLNENIKENKVKDKVKTFNVGLGSKKSHASLGTVDPRNTGTTKLKEDEHGAVEILPLDEVLTNEHGKISTIKIDVEGMEIEVLRGASKVLKEHKPLIYAEAGTDAEFRQLNEFLRSFNYKPMSRFNATATYLFTT